MKRVLGIIILGCLFYSQAWATNQSVFTRAQINAVKITYHASAPQNGLIEIWTNENKFYAVSLPNTTIQNVSQMAHDIRNCSAIVIRWEEMAGAPQRRNVTDFWMSIQ